VKSSHKGAKSYTSNALTPKPWEESLIGVHGRELGERFEAWEVSLMKGMAEP
jgi:hypothetical protein